MSPAKILNALNIRPGEGWLVSWMLVYAFFMGVPALITETAAYSLFLEKFNAQAIPYIYIGFAIVTTLSGLAYTYLEKRISFSLFVSINLAILALIPLLFRIVLQVTDGIWALPSLAIWYEVSWALASLGFWSMAVHLFDLRQGKRLFGLIGVGLTLSEAMSGFLIPAFVRLVGTANLLIVASISFLAALVVQTYILKCYSPSTESTEEETTKTDPAHSLRDLFKNKYIVLIFALAGLYAVSFYALDNAFYDQVEISYPNADELASFLGVFFGLSSLLTLILGAFVSGKLISQYGLRFGLLLMPVVILIGTGTTAVIGSLFDLAIVLFWLVVATRFLNEILAYTINRAAWQVLYEPLPEQLQLRSQTVVESIIKPVAGGLAGVLLIIFSAIFGFSTLQIVYLLIGILIAWIGVVIWINRLYPTILLQILVKHRLNETPIEINPSHIDIFKEGLLSQHAGVVIYSLDKLETLVPESIPQFLENLLTHPTPEIRQTALNRIEISRLATTAPAVKHLIENDPSGRVQGQALRTYVALGEANVIDEVTPYLDASSYYLRLGAMIGLLQYTQHPHQSPNGLGRKLAEWTHSPYGGERILAAKVLVEIELDSFNSLLLRLLDDEQLEVRKAALLATKKLHDPKIWMAVVNSLGVPNVRSAAFQTLVNAGDKIVNQLQETLPNHHHHKAMLIHLIRVCGQIRGAETISILKNYISFPDVQVRTQALTALRQLKYQASEAEQSLIKQGIKTEVAQVTWVLATLASFRDDTQWQLVETALKNELARYRTRIVLLLSFIYPRQTILSAWDNLGGDDSSLGELWDKEKTYALEIIDVTISSELKPLILPLFDNLTPEQCLAQLEQIFPQPEQNQHQYLQEIITASEEQLSPWTKAATLHAITMLGLKALVPAVIRAVNSTDSLVYKTALFTLHQLDSASYNKIITNGHAKEQTNYLSPSLNQEKKMQSLVERIILLKAVGIFSETPEEVLAEVAVLLEEVEAKTGESIIKQGDLGNSLYIIIDGRVKVHDDSRIITELNQSEVFGEFSLLDPGPRIVTVTALEDTRLFQLDQEAFLELLDNHSTIARKTIQVLVRYLRNAHFQFNALVYRDTSFNSSGQ